MNPYQSYAGSPPNRVPPRHPSTTQQPTQPASQSTPVPQSMQRLSIPYLQSLTQQQLMQNKNPAAFDFITDPTKRIKLSQQDYAETGLKVDEAPRRIQALTRENLQGVPEATEEVAQRPSNTDRRLVRPQPNIDRGTAPRESKEAFDQGFKNSEIPSIRQPGNLEKANLPTKVPDSSRASADMWNMPAFQQFLPKMETERSRDRSNVQSNLLMKDDLRGLGLPNFDLSFPVMKGLSQSNFGGSSGSDPLIMPELLDLMKNPHVDPQMKQNLMQAAQQQMLLQQIEQQKMERFLHQQQVFQQLQQQQHLDLLLQHQYAHQMQQKMKFENMVLQQMQDNKNRKESEDPSKTQVSKKMPEVTSNQLRQLGSKPNLIHNPKEFSNPVMKGSKLQNFKESMEVIPENLKYSNEMKGGQELKAEEGYTKIEEMEYSSTEKSLSDQRGSKKASDDIKEEEKSNAPLKELKQQGRRRRSQNQTYDFGALAGAKNVAERAEPRRKNKWQMTQQQPLEEEFTAVTNRRGPKTNRNTTTTQSTQSRSTRRFAPTEVELPSSNVLMESEDATKENLNRTQEEIERQRQIWIQEVESEVVDYNHLLNLTITNDPEYTGSDNPYQGFVVVYKDELKDEEEGQEKVHKIKRTKRGGRYQAMIPEIDLTFSKGPLKRKHAELVWNPKAINENDLKKYLSDLCKALNCDSINEERALKLLKRKNYKKDKVKVNISKNEKFYHSFLTVPDNPQGLIGDKPPLQTNL